jgi:creatinine amidohydrolase
MMLALAPDTVRLDWIPDDYIPNPRQHEEIDQLVLRRGTRWPWSSGAPAISSLGIMGGDPHKALIDRWFREDVTPPPRSVNGVASR